jgi:hypothetical protein
MEREEQKSIPFLDMRLMRTDEGKIVSTFYMKPTASGRLLNFNSQHPMKMKLNIAHNLLNRMRNLTTNGDNHNETFKLLMKQNGFPISFINRIIHNKSSPLTATNVANNETPIFTSLPFINEITPDIVRILKKKCPQLRAGYRAEKKVGSLFTPLKQKLDDSQKRNVIYKINCTGCGYCYIGQTTTSLKARLGGHKSTVKLAKELKNDPNHKKEELDRKMSSALVSHTIRLNHEFDFEKAEIIDVAKSTRLNVLEMLHIKLNKCVNNRTDTMGLSSTYKVILSHVNNNNHPVQSSVQRNPS